MAETRNERIAIRVTDEQREQLKRMAGRLSMSAYMLEVASAGISPTLAAELGTLGNLVERAQEGPEREYALRVLLERIRGLASSG